MPLTAYEALVNQDNTSPLQVTTLIDWILYCTIRKNSRVAYQPISHHGYPIVDAFNQEADPQL